MSEPQYRDCTGRGCREKDCETCFPQCSCGLDVPCKKHPYVKKGTQLEVATRAFEVMADVHEQLFPSDSKATNPKDAVGSGKVPLELFPDTARIAGAMSFLEGALKYGRYNWRCAGVRASIYKAALDRHMSSWWNGEDIDPDSGMPHTWKALACLAVLIDAQECDKLTDDRPPRADVPAMLKRALGIVGQLKERYGHVNPKQYTIEDSRP